MRSMRERSEKFFKALARFICRYRYLVAFLMLALALGLSWPVPHLVTDTSAESFLRPNDPAMVFYNAFREQYGSDEFAVIALRAKQGDIFEKDFLLKLKALHKDLEHEVPYLDEVTSLINARHTRGENDTLLVEELLENWPETPRNLEDIQ